MKNFIKNFNPLLQACKIFLVFPPRIIEINSRDKIFNLIYTIVISILWTICYSIFTSNDKAATDSPSNLAKFATNFSATLGMIFLFYFTIKNFIVRKEILEIFRELMEINKIVSK